MSFKWRRKRPQPDYEHAIDVDPIDESLSPLKDDMDPKDTKDRCLTIAFLNTAPSAKPEMINWICGRNILPSGIDQHGIPISLINKPSTLSHGFDYAQVVINYTDGSMMDSNYKDIDTTREYLDYVVHTTYVASVVVYLPFESNGQTRVEIPEMTTYVCMPIFPDTINMALRNQLEYMFDIHTDEIIWCHNAGAPVPSDEVYMRYIIRHFLSQMVSIVILLTSSDTSCYANAERDIGSYFCDLWRSYLVHIGRPSGGPYCPMEINPSVIHINRITKEQSIKRLISYISDLAEYYRTCEPISKMPDFDLICAILDTRSQELKEGIERLCTTHGLQWTRQPNLVSGYIAACNDLVDVFATHFERTMIAAVDPRSFHAHMGVIEREVYDRLFDQLLPRTASTETINFMIQDGDWGFTFKGILDNIKWICSC